MRRASSMLMFSAAAMLTLLAASCGSGGAGAAGDSHPDALSVAFVPGPIPYAVEAAIEVSDLPSVTGVAFTIHGKSGCRCRDVHVEYASSWLERERAIDVEGGRIRVPVFGLYADYANEVTIEVEWPSGRVESGTFTVPTDPDPETALPTLDVQAAADDPGLDFILLQPFGPPAIVDVDGEVRWRAPDVGDVVFPRAQTPGGLVVGSLSSGAIYRIDWLGRWEASTLSDPRCFLSHHNIEAGKTGFLDTVSFQDGSVMRPLSVLVEMTAEGVVTKMWDFDEIFRDHILAHGEEPSLLVQDGLNWFHMNSAIYDATDDSILASSRENFVVKVDYATGAIRWLLGNPGKLWYEAFPDSLQPYALTVIGDPPIGQHALSLSPDGSRLMVFDNGTGGLSIEDHCEDRGYSRVVVYEIDEESLTATEVLDLEFERGIYAPYCSSAYWTATGDVLVVFTDPQDVPPPEPVIQPASRFLVVDVSGSVLFDAKIGSTEFGLAYSGEEIRLDDLRIE